MSAYSGHDSKGFEECQEFVAWLEPEVTTAWRLPRLKGFFLHCQICGYDVVRRLDILVAEPHRDSGEIKRTTTPACKTMAITMVTNDSLLDDPPKVVLSQRLPLLFLSNIAFQHVGLSQ